jgi:group I intron endonuclease
MVIYKTTNLVNGKIYIGQDSKNNPNYFGSGDLIKIAINKYGLINFKKEILCLCETQTELNEMEQKFILEYKSTDKSIGYNICVGGTNGTMLNRKHSEETKQQMSEVRIGIIFTDEHKKNLSKAHKGKSISDETKEKMSKSQKLVVRKPMSDETKEKIRNSKKGVKLSEETKKKMSESHMGEKNHFYGKTHSKETIIKISEAKKGVPSKKKGVKYV